jgi:hypothetical protein
MTDYGFAPHYRLDPNDKVDRFIFALWAYLRECRANTEFVDLPDEEKHTIQNFVSYLAKLPSARRPAGDLLVGAHSRFSGQRTMVIDFDAETHPFYDRDGDGRCDTCVEERGGSCVRVCGESAAKHEVTCTVTNPAELQSAMLSRSVRLPAGITRPGSILYLLTCWAGRDRKFLELFRQALGGSVAVRAPTGMYFLYPVDGGVFEWIDYHFLIARRPTSPEEWKCGPIKDWDGLVQAFAERKFPLIDNKTEVPPAKWRSWIRKDALDHEWLAYPMAVSLGGPRVAGLRTLFPDIVFIREPDLFRSGRIKIDGPIPDSHAARLRLFREKLSERPDFQAGYVYPEYLWRGYPGLDEFLDGFYWHLRPQETVEGNFLWCTGIRHLYALAVPITDPSSTAKVPPLIYNFHPVAGEGKPLIHMPYDDSRYFTTVGGP